MSKTLMGLLLGGVLPAVLFGFSGLTQKLMTREGTGVGPYLTIGGLGVTVVGLIVTWLLRDSATSRAGIVYSASFGMCWATGVACVVIALKYFHVPLSVLVPLYNMNTLVTVILTLLLFAEWREVHSGRLLLASVLIIAGGMLAATSGKAPLIPQEMPSSAYAPPGE